MNIDLNKINSITKYPSILTYHQIADNERHGLKEELVNTSVFEKDEDVYLYEKIDGENSRIVLIGDGHEVDYFIGSRRELLFAKGDRIGIPTGNIANYFKPTADKLANWFKGSVGVLVVYFESYGGKTSKAKQYTNDKTQFGRVFDAFELNPKQLEDLLNSEPAQIASWRDNGGQTYFSRDEIEMLTQVLDLPVAPLVGTLKGREMPTKVEETLEWLKQYKETKVGINQTGNSEGVIARTYDRKKIAKIRFEDYEKTIRFREKNKNGK